MAETTYLMQQDGRLFRCAQRGLRAVRMELTDWETGAPFLAAEAVEGGWDVTVGPAGAQLESLVQVALLWAVELIEADASEREP